MVCETFEFLKVLEFEKKMKTLNKKLKKREREEREERRKDPHNKPSLKRR